VAGEYEDQSRKIGEPTSIFMDGWSSEYLPFDITDFRSVSSIPKLDRTMSDVYNDELYSPSFTYTSAPSTKVENIPMSHPQSAVFSQMLQAANNQHLSAPSRSPLGDQGRDQKIAFREGSPLAPVTNSFASPNEIRICSTDAGATKGGERRSYFTTANAKDVSGPDGPQDDLSERRLT